MEDDRPRGHEHHATAAHGQAEGHETTGGGKETAHRSAGKAEHSNHAHMVTDYRRRLWVSLIITVPVLVLSPGVRSLFGSRDAALFNGEEYIVFALSTVIFFYGGLPFLKGILEESFHQRCLPAP